MIDHVTDTNHANLYNITRDMEMPDFVKEASLIDKDRASLLGSNLFADENRRLFPTQSKADTWVSAAFYEKYAKAQYEEKEAARVKSRLDDMCAFWGVEYPQAPVYKEASSDVRISYRYDGVEQNSVTVSTKEQFEKLASFVSQGEGAVNLPWEMRRDAARQMIDKNASFANVVAGGLLTDLHKTAGYGVGSIQTVSLAIKKRQVFMQKEFGKEASDNLNVLLELADTTEVSGIVPPESLDKIASALDAVDKVLEITYKYGSTLTPPEDDLFTFTVLDADMLGKEAVQLSSGQTVSNALLNDYAVRAFIGEFVGGTPEKGMAKEAAAKLTPRQSATVYNMIQQRQAS